MPAADPVRTNPGWEHDEKLAAGFATDLAAALLAVIPARSLAAAWHAHLAAGGHPDDARGWLLRAGVLAGLIAVLRQILRQLWAAGWDLGVDSGNELTGTSIELAAQALDDFLEQAEADRLAGMAETRLGQIAEALEDADPGEPVSVLASAIEQEIGSEARALLVTQTEVTWSMAEGMLGVFYQAGSTTVAWLSAGDPRVCPACEENQDEGFIPIGEPFPSGATQPPQHPRCRCALMPGDIHGWTLPVPEPSSLPAAISTFTGRR